MRVFWIFHACFTSVPVLAELGDVPQCSGWLDDPWHPQGHQWADQKGEDSACRLLPEGRARKAEADRKLYRTRQAETQERDQEQKDQGCQLLPVSAQPQGQLHLLQLTAHRGVTPEGREQPLLTSAYCMMSFWTCNKGGRDKRQGGSFASLGSPDVRVSAII